MRPQTSYGRLSPRGLPLLAMLALIFMMTGAKACPICFSGLVLTIGQQLDAADRAVLAVPLGDRGQFQIVAVIKGKSAIGEIVTDPVSKLDSAALRSGKPLLLLENDLTERWTSMGAIGGEYAPWLRRLAVTGHVGKASAKQGWPRVSFMSSDMTDDEWRVRLELVAPYLENTEPLAAEIAFGEMMRAPYATLASIKPIIESMPIEIWTDDPKLASRRATYTLLLGIVGHPDEAARLELRLETALRSHDATNLSAMLAADLEIRGPVRVASIEKDYLADGSRTLPEIEAALLALSVHGGANGAVPRERVIQAYRFFMEAHKPMAGFVAPDLGDWGYWDAVPEYAALLKSDALKDPASSLAVVSYLQRAPHPAAQSARQSTDKGE